MYVCMYVCRYVCMYVDLDIHDCEKFFCPDARNPTKKLCKNLRLLHLGLAEM